MRSLLAIAASCVLGACGGQESALPNAVALSPDGARQTSFSYSPDGKRIAYWSPPTDSGANWQLWVANADLSAPVKLPATVFFSSPPIAVWSPDGSRLAASSSEFGAAHVVVVPAAGGAVQRLTPGTGVEFPLAWYKGGEELSYFGSAAGGVVKSFLVSVKTGVSAPLVPGEKRPSLGAPSPDGSHVAYFVIDGGKTTIWVADSVGENARQLTTEGFEALEQYQEWSPDGKELLYESRRTGTTDLWIVPIDGGKARRLTHDVRNDFAGVWSPDGKWVAFLSDRGRQTDVWVVPAAGGAEQRVTDTPVEEQPWVAWRPGTHTLAYAVKGEKSGVWALDLADGKERRLTPDSLRTSWLRVSPDGKQVDFVIEHGGGIEDLAVMPLAGGAARILVAGGGTVQQPLWSPDGSKIVFVSDRGGSTDIWVVDAARGTPRQLVNWPSSENGAAWSTDGSDIYFTSDRDSKLGDVWKVSVAGGIPTRVTKDGTVNNNNGALLSHSGAVNFFGATLSAKGGQIAISRFRPDGSIQTVWDRTNGFLSSMSPSGDLVAALVEQPDGKQRSMILSANGGGGRVILKPGELVGKWSNDGASVLYQMNSGGATDLGVLHIADGTTRRLTTTREDESSAEFTPDGKTVVFQRTQTVQRIFTADLTKLLEAIRVP